MNQDDFNRELGIRLKKLRKGKKIKQEEIAKACGLSKGHISLLERGSCKATINVLMVYSDMLGIPIDILVGNEKQHGRIIPELALKLSQIPAEEQRKFLNIIDIL